MPQETDRHQKRILITKKSDRQPCRKQFNTTFTKQNTEHLPTFGEDNATKNDLAHCYYFNF
jgi:hypothetical protein